MMQTLTSVAKRILVLAFGLIFMTAVQAQDPQTGAAKPDQAKPDQAQAKPDQAKAGQAKAANGEDAAKPTDKIKITEVGKGKNIVKEELNFQLTPTLKLVHVYKKGDLIHVRVTNTGEPVKLTMFHEDYFLGKDDNLEVDIPNVQDYFVSWVPTSERDLANGVKSRGAERTFHVHDVSKQKNNTVDE